MAARKRRTRRTAAQRAATRKLVAFNKRGGKRRSPAKRKRRRNPIAKRRAYRAVRTTTTPTRRRRNPIRRGIVDKLVIPAVTATAGALALDIAWAYLPLPVTIKAGPLKHVAKAAGAIGLSILAGNVVKKSTADAMGLGALTVVLHQAAKEMIQRVAPQVQMDGIGYYSAGLPVGGFSDNMGLYVADNAPPAMAGNEYDELGLYVGS